ncbi:MAG: UPF0149 family protein [bacterium]
MSSSARSPRTGHEPLRRLLESDSAPEGTMSLEELHGFLSAVISGPELIMPSECMPLIWGGEHGPDFRTIEQARESMAAIMALWNEIAGQLMAGTAIVPLLDPGTEPDQLALVWAEGFVRGIALRHPEWRTALDDPEMLEHVMLILQLSEGKIDAARRRTLIPQTPLAVKALQRFWLERRRPASPPCAEPTRASGPKVGRNAPCPCGSGRKYKHCCGGTGTWH